MDKLPASLLVCQLHFAGVCLCVGELGGLMHGHLQPLHILRNLELVDAKDVRNSEKHTTFRDS